MDTTGKRKIVRTPSKSSLIDAASERSSPGLSHSLALNTTNEEDFSHQLQSPTKKLKCDTPRTSSPRDTDTMECDKHENKTNSSDQSSTTRASSSSLILSNPVAINVSAHLPPVLTLLVMQYYSGLLPARHHYNGHAYLDNNAYYRFNNEPRLHPTVPHSLAPTLRLDHRSFSWSGWMNRTSTVDNQFLFSFSNPHLHIPPMLSNLHVGYRHYEIRSRHVDCFTFGFWCNDLDHKAIGDVTNINQWEHWVGNFEFPTATTVSNDSSLQSLMVAPALGHRRLYRNGVQVCEDDCPAFTGTHCELSVGNRLVHSAAREGLKGGIGDFRIWSRVLSDEEVVALFEGDERQVSSARLEIHYKFDESEDGLPIIDIDNGSSSSSERARLLFDYSGHNRHATLIMPADVRAMHHSCTTELGQELASWEGQAH